MSVRVTGFASLKRRGYLSVALRTDERCRVTIGAKHFRTVTTRLTPGERTVVRLRSTKPRQRVLITVRAVDDAGNVRILDSRYG